MTFSEKFVSLQYQNNLKKQTAMKKENNIGKVQEQARLIVGSYGATNNYTYEDYKEFCECNEIEPKGEDSQEYWDWVSEEQYRDWRDFLENLKYASANEGYYAITFNLGLWDGHHKGYISKVFNSLKDAIEECANSSRGYDDYKLEYENGMMYFYGMHHDGTNVLEIGRLSKAGERKLVDKIDPDWEKEIENEKNFKRIKFDDLF